MKNVNRTAPGFRLKHGLGQHLLIDKNIARKIASAIFYEWSPRLLEIGPGAGALTEFLVERAERLVAVEIDRQFAETLGNRFEHHPGFSLVQGDILEQDWSSLLGDGDTAWQIAGNLPYQITSPVIFRVLKFRQRLRAATFMVQREVADRIAAPGGTRKRGILSVLCQYYAEVHKLFNVSRRCFRPPPNVDSAVIQLVFYREMPVSCRSDAVFEQVVKQAFNQRRKKMSNSLAAFNRSRDPIVRQRHDLDRRPETLSVAEFAALADDLIEERE